MRVIRKLFVLGLAVMGAARVWELAMPRLDDLRQRLEVARERARPAARRTVASAEEAWEQARGAGDEPILGVHGAPPEPMMQRTEVG